MVAAHQGVRDQGRVNPNGYAGAKRIVVLALATPHSDRWPLRVMGGCIELWTAWPHHPNNRTRWCAGSACQPRGYDREREGAPA
jgi:hypothetical protein